MLHKPIPDTGYSQRTGFPVRLRHILSADSFRTIVAQSVADASTEFVNIQPFYICDDKPICACCVASFVPFKEQVSVASKHSARELMEEVNADRQAHGKKPFDGDGDTPPAASNKHKDNTSKKNR